MKHTIAEHFICYIAYGETDCLTDAEERQIGEYLSHHQAQAPEGFVHSHWDITDDTDEFTRCDVTGLMNKCVTVNQIFFEKETT